MEPLQVILDGLEAITEQLAEVNRRLTRIEHKLTMIVVRPDCDSSLKLFTEEHNNGV